VTQAFAGWAWLKLVKDYARATHLGYQRTGDGQAVVDASPGDGQLREISKLKTLVFRPPGGLHRYVPAGAV